MERDESRRQAPHGGALRKGRVSLPNQPYLVTSVVAERRPLFADVATGRLLVRCLRRQHDAGRVESLAFVVMPDHLHWLLVLHTGSSLSDVMRSVKGEAARLVNLYLEARGVTKARKFWQDGFYDRGLRADEDVLAAARYLVANPLRAGLVERIGDYPLWDAKWLF